LEVERGLTDSDIEEDLHEIGEKLLEIDRLVDSIWNWTKWIEKIGMGYECPYCRSRNVLEKEFRGDDPRVEGWIGVDESEIFWYCPECDVILEEPMGKDCEKILSEVMHNIDGLMDMSLRLRGRISEILELLQGMMRVTGENSFNPA